MKMRNSENANDTMEDVIHLFYGLVGITNNIINVIIIDALLSLIIILYLFFSSSPLFISLSFCLSWFSFENVEKWKMKKMDDENNFI